MKNKLLAVSHNCIPYVAELRPFAGSVTACILWLQLEYWFSIMGKTFYKFLEPSEKHTGYKKGDSWVEELGFSKDEFRSAFDRIGTRYSSKTAFDQETDTFKGKYFASFHDKIRGLTFYLRNHDLADAALETVFSNTSVNQKSQFTEIKKSHPRKSKMPIPIIGETEITKKTTTTSLEDERTNALERLISKLPRELQLDDQVQAMVAKTLQDKGEEYVLSNIKATLEQAKSSKKGFLLKALQIDFGHLQRARIKAAAEKDACLADERKARDKLHKQREKEGPSAGAMAFSEWAKAKDWS